MKYTKLGNSGLEVSRICLGCMNFGDETPGSHDWSVGEDQTRPILEHALESGINFFDTANAYSVGTSERIVGKLLGEMANRDEIVVATKVYFPVRRGRNARGLSRKAIMTEVDASASAVWGPTTSTSTRSTAGTTAHRSRRRCEALHDVGEGSGKVRYIGASSMWAWQFAKALSTSARAQRLDAASSRCRTTTTCSTARRSERCSRSVLDQGVGVIPWSPLARGLLTRDWSETTKRRETDPLIDARFEESRDRGIVERVAQVADQRGVPRAQVALAWVLANPVVTAPIIGAGRIEHVSDAVASVELELSDEERAQLEELYTPRGPAF